MSDIDNFDIEFAQRQYLVCYFYVCSLFVQDSVDNAENANRLLFYCPSYIGEMLNTMLKTAHVYLAQIKKHFL